MTTENQDPNKVTSPSILHSNHPLHQDALNQHKAPIEVTHQHHAYPLPSPANSFGSEVEPTLMAPDKPNPPPTSVVPPVEIPPFLIAGNTVEPVPIISSEESTLLTEPMVEIEEQQMEESVIVRPKNAEQVYPTSIPLTDKDKNEPPMLALPSDTQENIFKTISSTPNVNIDGTITGNNWLNVIRASRQATPFYSADDGLRSDDESIRPDYSTWPSAWFRSTVERNDSAYKQVIQSEKGKLAAASPQFSDKGTVNLTGEAAVLKIRSLVGLGSVIQIPLWHSGFWITFKAPSDGALLELNRRLSEDKVTLGRQTYGLAFANTSAFFTSAIMNFALMHVYDTTLKTDITQNEMRSLISSLDIPLIAWGLACAIWPKGFPYARSVLSQVEEQHKIVRERLNVSKLLWTDSSSLTPWQISHMSARHGNTMSREVLERYRKEFTRGTGREVKLTEELSITLRTPNLDQYLTSGYKWVMNIENMVTSAFGLSQDEGVRDQYILDQGKATNMRQFAHFVESVNAGPNRIIDAETIDDLFDSLSSSDDIRDVYFKGIRSFIEDATMSIVAIPVSEQGDTPEFPRFPHLLALDVLSVFFILLGQKVQQIQLRD